MKYITFNTGAIKARYKGLRSRAARYLIESRKGDPLKEVHLKWYLKLKYEAEGIVSLLYVGSGEFTSEDAVEKFLKS